MLDQLNFKAHNGHKKRETDAQYKIRIALPSWKLISPTSLRNLYVGCDRSIFHCTLLSVCVCTFAAVRTFILRIFLKLHSCNYTHIDHKGDQVGCERPVIKTLYLHNRVPSPLYLGICINVILTVSTGTRLSCS